MDKCKSSCLLIFLTLTVFLSACSKTEAFARKIETIPIHPAKVSPTASKQASAATHTLVLTSKVTRVVKTILAHSIASSSPFTTLPPGSSLPSDAECAARVQLSSWEPRPGNTTANHTNVYAQGHRLTGSYLAQYGYEGRVTGNFTGTTDEILQWGACKWGIDVNVVRSQAVQEGYWRQSTLGGCSVKSQPETHGCDTVGILQVRGAGLPPIFPHTWPYAYESTAFNVDYTLTVWRTCFEGKETWLGNGYHAGDLWGCVGRWYSGGWYQSSQNYIASVKDILANHAWLKPRF